MKKGPIDITLEGTSSKPIGVNIEYGVGRIPTAVIDVDASTIDKAFLCNPESKWRQEMSLQVKTAKGCLAFDGLFDGISISQTPGDVHYSIVLKSRWQRFLEAYPRAPGISPNSVPIFFRSDNTFMNIGFPDQIYQKIRFGPDGVLKQQGNPIPNFIIDAAKAVVTLEQGFESFQSLMGINMEDYYELLKNPRYQETLRVCKELFDKINFTAVAGCPYQAGTNSLEMIRVLTNGGLTIWDMMLEGLALIQCTLLVGNEQAWVVPMDSFLKIPHTQPSFRDKSDVSSTDKIPNTAYPSEYSNYLLNSNGYKDIYACYLISGDISEGNTKMHTYLDAGHFIDKDSKATGAVIERVSSFMTFPMFGGATLNTDTQNNKKNGVPHVQKGKQEWKDIQQKIKENTKRFEGAVDTARKTIGNNLAQLKYYQAKYGDRTGSFATEFNPKWVPGTTGTLYTRYPGIWIDFYVTNVSHRISLSAPSNGTAITVISFSSARSGKDGEIAGIDNYDFFQYNTGGMLTVQRDWIDDTTKA